MSSTVKSFVLALDQGTTSSRAILFDSRGVAVRKAQQPFRQSFPQPGWVEHDPEEIWQTQMQTAREAIRGHEHEVAAIGITNQRETTILWDRRTGEPIAPAIVWQDRRTAAHCEELVIQQKSEFIRSRTGLEIDAYFSATKIAWLLSHVRDREHLAFGTIDTFLLWRLTSGRVHATDVTNASRTMLFDLTTGGWSPELCDLFGIPVSILPEIRPSSSAFGHTDLLGPEIPITGIAGDQHAATFGQACFHPGMAKNTYGTGCFLLANTGDQPHNSANRLLTTTAWRLADQSTQFAIEGSVFIAGALIQWLCEEMQIASSPAEAERLAQSVETSSGVVIVPAFTGLGAPHWDPHARGTILGLTRGTNRAHVCRAAFEAIALQTCDLVRSMEADFGEPLRELRVDGGGAGSDFLMQLQADLLGIPVVRPDEIETTARGAAFLAGLSVGLWNSTAEIEALWTEDRRFEPAMPDRDQEALFTQWERALERSRSWASFPT